MIVETVFCYLCPCISLYMLDLRASLSNLFSLCDASADIDVPMQESKQGTVIMETSFIIIGRVDIEGSKSNVTMNAWLPRASYPCGNFSEVCAIYIILKLGEFSRSYLLHMFSTLIQSVSGCFC